MQDRSSILSIHLHCLFLIAGCASFSAAGVAQSAAPAKQLAHGAGQAVKPLVEVSFEVGKLDEKGRVILAAPIETKTVVIDIDKISPRAAAEKALAESHKAPAIAKASPTWLSGPVNPLQPPAQAGQAQKTEMMESKSQKPVEGTSFVAIPSVAPLKGSVFFGPIPPDITVAAGPNQLVVASNLVVATFDKLGNLLGSSALGGSTGFFKQLAPNFGSFGTGWLIFDPVVHFDEYLKRFWLTAGALNNSTSQSLVLIALSHSSDATDGWSLSTVDMTLDGSSSTSHACDYPHLGFDTQAIYITCNMFDFPLGGTGNNFDYGKVRVLAKKQFLSHTCCSWFDQWNLPETVQPAIMHHAKNSDGEYLVDASGESGGSGDGLDVYHFPDPINNPSELDQTSVSVGGYYTPPGAPQPGGAQQGPLIDTGDARLQFAIWQAGNLASGQNSLCTNADTYAACAIYYELNVSGFPNVSVVNNWAMQAEDVAYYYPSAEEDSNSDKIMVFTESIGGPPGGGGPAAEFVVIPNPSTCTGCVIGVASTHSGFLTDTTVGTGPYFNTGGITNGRNRWGDYQGAAADPDGRGIWIAGEDVASPTQWAIAVGSLYKQYAPALTISPTSVNFSDTKSSKSWEHEIKITNSGNADLILGSIKLSGSSDFSISSNTCKEGNPQPSKGALEPNENCEVTVRFKPSSGGEKTAALNICSNVNPICLAPTTVPLSFNGPVISKIKPNNGPLASEQVTVNGDGLSDKFTFEFGGKAATGVNCTSSTTCTMATPAAQDADTVSVIAKSSDVSSSSSPDAKFTYQAPAITKISPAVGPTTGGQSVQLTGVGFYPEMVVKFGNTTVTTNNGGIPTTTVNCPTDTSCSLTSPAGTGSVNITATLAKHTSPSTPSNLYTYAIFPSVSNLQPDSGPVTGGISVTVTGTNFSTAPGGTTFKFGPLEPTNVNCTSMQCTMTAPTRPAGSSYLKTSVTAAVDGHTSIEWVGFAFGTPPPPVKVPPGSGGGKPQ